MNNTFCLKAYAKINLGLKVLRQRADGYHDLESVMQQVSLADTLLFEPAAVRGCNFFCTDPRLSGPENLVNRAAALLQKKHGRKLPGVQITLYKSIPAEAGLAGGSADAAAALVGLNRFWKLDLHKSELLEAGAELGSDVPFCLIGGTALAGGRGERLQELPPLPFFWTVIAVPENEAISTAASYNSFDKRKMGEPPLEPLVEAIHDRDKQKIISWLARDFTNTLETAVDSCSSKVKGIKNKLANAGFSPVMSGSGPAIFVLTENWHDARDAICAAEQEGARVYLCWVTSGNKE